MNHKRYITMVRASLVSLGLVATAWSQNVPVANSGFEDPVVGDGSTGSPADWNDVAGGGQVFNPTASQYSSGPPEGDNVASVYQGSAGDGLSQTLSGVTGRLQENAVYSLSVKVGDPAEVRFDGYRVQLLADGTVLAEDDNAASIPNGGFATVTVPYTYDAGSHAALVGKPLEIRLLSKALNSGDVHFDDVQLTVTLTTPIADPGGPYEVLSPGGSLALDGSGSLPSGGDGITLYE